MAYSPLTSDLSRSIIPVAGYSDMREILPPFEADYLEWIAQRIE
jgi:hypothetical protein